MPIYEYDCPSCGVVEVFQGIKDAPLTKCPTCHKRKVKKIISESSFHLKGTGWYTTDYARKGNGGNGKKGAEHGSEHGSDKGSDAPVAIADKECKPKDSPAKDASSKDSSSKGTESTASSST